jgi:hypothetical protein
MKRNSLIARRGQALVLHLSPSVRILVVGVLLAFGASARAQVDPLPSWNDGPAKQTIIDFVKATTRR